jgi:four helix bundle protein
MASRHNYKNLEVWKKARGLVKDIYVVTRDFPADERFGLTSQFRRAVVSISLNIAEGSGRSTNKDFSHFLDNSFGSALEVENLIFLSLDLEFISQKTHDELVEKVTEIQRMLKGFQAQLNNSKTDFLKSVVLSLGSLLLVPGSQF